MSYEGVTITEDIRKEYINALCNSQNGSVELMAQFKEKYPREYSLINTMYRKRVSIKESLDVMQYLNEPLYWFTLTFNNSKDKNNIASKRKEAMKYLNSLCLVYLLIEEFGEDNGRYHVHGFLCFKYGYGFEDFKKWHSRQNLVLIDEKNCVSMKKIRYLTNYSAKSAPRIRRSRSLSRLYAYYKSHKRFSRNFPKTFVEEFNNQIAKCVNPF